ncbi:Protein of unknown function [Cotesia congregata]|uniref:Uncharacterized protein n=1 Tax=Cotesia congregata TaxID=51543 RepID=A0A8J2EE84_COTCN|nr:Protein of unknown function [Cotesia congregata]
MGINFLKFIFLLYLPISMGLQIGDVEEAAIDLIDNFEKLVTFQSNDSKILEAHSLKILKNVSNILEKLKSTNRYLRERNPRVDNYFEQNITELFWEDYWKDYNLFYKRLDNVTEHFDTKVKNYFVNYKNISGKIIDEFFYNTRGELTDDWRDVQIHQVLKIANSVLDKILSDNTFFILLLIDQIIFMTLNYVCGNFRDILIGVYKSFASFIGACEIGRIKHLKCPYWMTGVDLLNELRASVIKVMKTGHDYLIINKNEYLTMWDEFDYKLNKWMYMNCDALEWSEERNYIRVKNYVAYYEQRTKWYFDPNADYLDTKESEYECDGIRANFNPLDLPQGIEYSMYCPIVFLENFDSEDTSCRKYGWNNVRGYKKENWTSACILGDHSELLKLCACDKQVDNDISVRLLSLREYYTNSSDNRVVTGIRFAVEKNVITLQIQEGHLVNGEIDPSSVKWRTDGGHPADGPTQTVQLSYKIRGFNLDDINMPDGQFVTGVKFVVTKDDRISIAVRGSVMYNSEGSFYSSSVGDRWFYPSKINSTDRMNIDISSRKNPRDSELTYELSKTGQHYVNLTISLYSEKSHNAAIVPFLDSRPVITLPPAPISGLGFFYKGTPDYAGFLSFKYITSRFKRFSQLPVISILSNRTLN